MAVSSPIDLEVCVDSVESAIDAVKKGAIGVELCANIHEGCFSPSIGLLKVVKNNISLPIFVVVRPHRTDYVYSESEFEIMLEEVNLAKQIGASGFIFACLTPNNQVDLRRCSILLNQCRPLRCTFSRAFDYVTNPVIGLEDVIKCGFDRVVVGPERYNLVPTLQDKAQNRIKIICTGRKSIITADKIIDGMRDGQRRLSSDEVSRKNHELYHEDNGFSLASLLMHPTVLNKLRMVDVRPILVDILKCDVSNDRYATSSPLDSTPASPQMASVQRLRNISPSNEHLFKTVSSPDSNGLEYVSAFNPLKPMIMVSGDISHSQESPKPLVQRRTSLQVPDVSSVTGGFTEVSRRRSLDEPASSNAIRPLFPTVSDHTTPSVETMQMDTNDRMKESNNVKKERSLSAPEALYYPGTLADQVLAFKHVTDPRILGHQNATQCSMRTMLRMNVRRGPLQKKLDALKASTHIDEEFNAVMNVNENSCGSDDTNQHLNSSLREMEIGDYSMTFKRKRSYGPNQKKIDDSNLMHALKSGLEFNRTLKQGSDFNVFKKEVETLYEGSECINERTLMCGKCGKTHHLSWLRYHQQFNTEHWVHCKPHRLPGSETS